MRFVFTVFCLQVECRQLIDGNEAASLRDQCELIHTLLVTQSYSCVQEICDYVRHSAMIGYSKTKKNAHITKCSFTTTAHSGQDKEIYSPYFSFSKVAFTLLVQRHHKIFFHTGTDRFFFSSVN